MELNVYQDKAMSTCLATSANPMYMLFGLSEEVGELMGKFSKAIRKGIIKVVDNDIVPLVDIEEYEEWKTMMIKELGDCHWMLSGVASVFGLTEEQVCLANLSKLQARKEAGTIDGQGDGITAAERL